MSDIGELPQVSQIETKKQQFSRREFIQMLFAGGVSACVPVQLIGRTEQPVLTTPNQLSQEPIVSIEQGIREFRPITVGYKKGIQMVTTVDNRVVSCEPPMIRPDTHGFIYNSDEYFWDLQSLPKVTIDGSEIPILTARRDLTVEELRFRQEWQSNPNLINERIGQTEVVTLRPISAMVLHYKSVQDDYYKEDGKDSSVRVFNDSSRNDPKQLFDAFTEIVNNSTDGYIQYEQRGPVKVISEVDLPLTNDPECTFPELLAVHDKTINYQAIAEAALANRMTTVFVFAGDNAGMFEHCVWTDRKTQTLVRIFGLNYNRPVESAIHSWTHHLEELMLKSKYAGSYLKWAGRDQEYTILPLILDYTPEGNNKQNEARMNNGTIHLAIGNGTVHYPPNAVYPYHFDSPIPVLMPGSTVPITSAEWGGTELGYLTWWLQRLPKAFLSTIGDDPVFMG